MYLVFHQLSQIIIKKQLYSGIRAVSTKLVPVWGARKQHRSVKLNLTHYYDMEDPSVEAKLQPLRDHVKEQADLVRKLKSDGAAALDVKKAVVELLARKKVLEEKELKLSNQFETFDRNKMEDLLKRRFFYDISFSIYGGVSGQYDFGPMGCAIKNNVLDLWRSFFILEEQMLQVDCSVLTPEYVLKASGHVDRFADLMVKDMKTGECFRLDHLIKQHLEKIIVDPQSVKETKANCSSIIAKLDGMNKEELGNVLKEYDIKSPLTNNALSEPIEFNLMFGTQIGPAGNVKGFLRPETAQGIFVNFKRLLEFNQNRLPFAAAQIGSAFRNEISPRSGLIRVREFTMAEIEHFCDPNDKKHPKFDSVRTEIVLLYSALHQMNGLRPEKMEIGQAVAKKIVDNETLAYFLIKIQQFLIKCGINIIKLRFRQHMPNEMAHYAQDCWDAEVLTSYGWIECVGCADRAAYDLRQHSEASGSRLVAEKHLSHPKEIEEQGVDIQKHIVGKIFKKDLPTILWGIGHLNPDQLKEMEDVINAKGEYQLVVNGKAFLITRDMVKFGVRKRTIHVEEVIPNVIEPSFGVGRIMYGIFEHNFRIRDQDEQRSYFALPSLIAPLKCCILPLSGNEEFVPFINTISKDLTKAGVSHKVDNSSGSIGRRYARNDAIGAPYAITIDFDTVTIKPHSVTLRERDSMSQVRIPLDQLPKVLNDLTTSSDNVYTWTNVQHTYPSFEQQEATK